MQPYIDRVTFRTLFAPWVGAILGYPLGIVGGMIFGMGQGMGVLVLGAAVGTIGLAVLAPLFAFWNTTSRVMPFSDALRTTLQFALTFLAIDGLIVALFMWLVNLGGQYIPVSSGPIDAAISQLSFAFVFLFAATALTVPALVASKIAQNHYHRYEPAVKNSVTA